MGYEIEVDKEITIGETIYSVFLEADIDYTNEEDPEPCEVEITKAHVSVLDGDDLPVGYSGRAIEKVVVEGHPELTEAIDKVLWDEIQKHTEDYYGDLLRDLRDARFDSEL